MRTFVNGILSDTHETGEEIDWGKTAIGRSGAGDAMAWKGQIAEIMIFAGMLKDDDQKELENYLYNKWLQSMEPRPLSDISFAVSPYLRAGSPGTAAGASIGSLSAADGYGSISYSLVSGDGDSDNGRFKIEGNSIIIQGANLAEGTYRFRVRAEDYYSRLEKSFPLPYLADPFRFRVWYSILTPPPCRGWRTKAPWKAGRTYRERETMLPRIIRAAGQLILSAG